MIVGRNVFKDANIFSFWEPLYSFIFFVSGERGRQGGGEMESAVEDVNCFWNLCMALRFILI